MELKRAIAVHLIFILAQPTYILLQYLLNPSYFATSSTTKLTIFSLIYLFIITKLINVRQHRSLWHLPQPEGASFPWGHTQFFSPRQPPVELTNACLTVPNDGLLTIWGLFFLEARVIPTTPETLLDVLNTHNYDWEKPGPSKKILHRILGEGLVNVEGNVHKAMRRTVAPAFSGRQIRDLVPLFWSKGRELADVMLREAKVSSPASSDDGTVEIMGLMSRVTLDIIGSSGIGMDFDTVSSDDNRLAKLYATVTSTDRGPILLFFLINVLLPPWIVQRLYGTVYARVANATDELRKEIRALLAEKKRTMELKTVKQNDIIATIMKSGDFSDDYLCDQMLTFLAAGHDTTASALTWTAWFLSSNPQMQSRLRQECLEHLSNNDTITADTFDNMPYLTAVCNETLRIYPTVPITVRIAAKDTKIGTTPISKNTIALIIPWAINRLPWLWGDDADKFNPDRWLVDNNNNGSSNDNNGNNNPSYEKAGGAKNPYAFMTFIHGPRSCVGQSFARTEMKCVLAALVMRFRFDPSESSPDVELGGFVTLKPMNGLRLKLHEYTAAEDEGEKL